MELGITLGAVIIFVVIIGMMIAFAVMAVLLGLAAIVFALVWTAGLVGVGSFWVRLLGKIRRGEIDPEEPGFYPLRDFLAGQWGLDTLTPAGAHARDERVVRVPVPRGE